MCHKKIKNKKQKLAIYFLVLKHSCKSVQLWTMPNIYILNPKKISYAFPNNEKDNF